MRCFSRTLQCTSTAAEQAVWSQSAEGLQFSVVVKFGCLQSVLHFIYLLKLEACPNNTEEIASKATGEIPGGNSREFMHIAS